MPNKIMQLFPPKVIKIKDNGKNRRVTIWGSKFSSNSDFAKALKKHRGRHVWVDGVESKSRPYGTKDMWVNRKNKNHIIATLVLGRTCKKCGKEERELRVIAESLN